MLQECVDPTGRREVKVVGLCRDCDHWNPLYGHENHGNCKKISMTDTVMRIGKSKALYGVRVATLGDFGCTLFELKEKPWPCPEPSRPL